MIRENAFPFSIVHMLHLDSTFSSNIYYASSGSKSSSFTRTIADLKKIHYLKRFCRHSINVYLLHSLFLFFSLFCLFVYLFVCLFIFVAIIWLMLLCDLSSFLCICTYFPIGWHFVLQFYCKLIFFLQNDILISLYIS